MAATSMLFRLNKAPLHALIQNHLLRPSLAAVGTTPKLFDISADSQLQSPNSASSKPLMGAEFQPTWKLPFGISTLLVMEHSRIKVRGRAVIPDRDEFEDRDDDGDDAEDGDVNDFVEGVDDFSDDAEYEDDDDADDSR